MDCLISRVEYESRLCTDDEALVQEVVDACRDKLLHIFADPVPAPVIASRVHRLAYRMLEDTDPYYPLKQANTKDALAVCRRVKGGSQRSAISCSHRSSGTHWTMVQRPTPSPITSLSSSAANLRRG
ncbi:MAG: hypothetical protein RQM90_06095 [Methanoculleus sp.]